MGILEAHFPLSPVDQLNQPPLWFLQVQDGLITACTLCWTFAYVLYARQAFIDKSYGLPLVCLCGNVSWELVYGILFPNSASHVAALFPWLIADCFIVYATIKFAPEQWKHSPLVANNLNWMIPAGILAYFVGHLAFLGSFEDRAEAFAWSAWICQFVISIDSPLHLLRRGNTGGHSRGIWFCRWIGTIFTIVLVYWRWYHYPESNENAMKPILIFILFGGEVGDLVYPFVYSYVAKRENAKTK